MPAGVPGAESPCRKRGMDDPPPGLQKREGGETRQKRTPSEVHPMAQVGLQQGAKPEGEEMSGKDIKRGSKVPWGKVKEYRFKAQEGCLAGGPRAVATRNQEIGFQAGVVAGWEARKVWEEEKRMEEIVKAKQ